MKKSALLFAVLMVAFIISGSAWAIDSKDIGDAANKPGSTEILPDGTVTIVGSGHDIWDTADGFRYVYIQTSGDFQMDVQITYFERVTQWAKAGLMARQSVDPGAKNALSTAAAGKPGDMLGVQLTWRAETDGKTEELDYWALGGPTGFNDGEWIRLKRAGNDYSASWSKDGKTWVADYAKVTVEMKDPILVGMAVTSCDATMLCKATFNNLTVNNKQIITSVSPSGKLSRTWGEVKSYY